MQPPPEDRDGVPWTGPYQHHAGGHTVEVFRLGEGVVRVRRRRGPAAPDRGWTLLPRATREPEDALRPQGDAYALETGELTLRLRAADGAPELVAPGLELRAAPADPGAAAKSGHAADSGAAAGHATDRAAVAFVIEPGDAFMGFGERTGPLNQRGRRVVSWTADPWWPEPSFTPDTDPLYQAIPCFMGLRGGRAFGVYVASTRKVVFDLGRADPNRLAIEVEGAGELDLVLIHGPSPRRVLERFTALVGRAPLPPLWALGYHQCRWSYAPESELRRVAGELRARRIPADGLWLDIDYMDGYRSFTWDRAAFPEPARLLTDLEAQGFKTTCIIDPGIKHDPDAGYAAFDEGLAGDHFVRRPDGSLYIGKVWPGDSVFPDFTREATRNWWAEQVARFAKSGVRGIWVDMNEPTSWVEDEGGFPLDARLDGEGAVTDLREGRNVYGQLMAEATREGLAQAAPGRRPFVLTRAGFAGIQRAAAVWTGDAVSSWEHLRMVPTMLMDLGLSGVPFVGSDVGGFSGDPGGELYLRWLQVGAFSPFFRAHVIRDKPAHEPWAFGPQIESASRAHIALRYRLLPYLYALFHEASVTGVPPLRPLCLEFPEDPDAPAMDDVFLLGHFLLVAPVLWPGARRRAVQLPPGAWVDFHDTGAVHQGPGRIELDAPLERTPLLVRANGILPGWPPLQYVGEARPDPLYLDLFPVAGAAPQSFACYLDDGESLAYRDGAFWSQEVRLAAEPSAVDVALGPEAGTFTPPHGRVWLRLHGVPRPGRVEAAGGRGGHSAGPGGEAAQRAGTRLAEAASLATLTDGEGWWWDQGVLQVCLSRSPGGARVRVLT